MNDYAITEHKTKSVFKDHGFPIGSVARYLNRGYNYTSSILCGRYTATKHIDAKLWELAVRLKNGE